MRAVVDSDILSTFAKIGRLDILNSLFDGVILPQAVISELGKAGIKITGLKHEVVKLSREELVSLTSLDPRLGRGESEAFVLAKHRNFPLASNDRIVTALSGAEGVGYLNLPRILRLAVLTDVVTRAEAREVVRKIEQEDRTIINGKNEIFK